MNFEDTFVPETTITETIKASVPDDVFDIPDTIVIMPDEIAKDNFKTTSIEKMTLVPENKSQNKVLELADLLPWDERTKDIILMSVIVACLLLAIVLGVITLKWRKEKLNAEKFNTTKIE